MHLRPIALLAASAGLCLAMSALPAPHAQALAAPSPAFQPGDSEPDSPPSDATFDVVFRGGTLGEYLDAVTEVAGTNIVAPDSVRSLAMPSVRLRGVTAWAAIQLVDSMFRSPESGAVGVSSVDGDESAPIFVLTLIEPASAERPASAVNDIFSIGDVLRPSNEEPTDLQVKKIFEMIDSAMTLVPAELTPEMAYHDDTQMLVFRGSPEQHRLIESVLERYHVAWASHRERFETLRHKVTDLELDAQTSSIETETARTRAEYLSRQVADLTALFAAGGVSASEVAAATDQLNTARAEAMMHEARAVHAQTRLAECRTALAALTPAERTGTVIYDFRELGARGDRLGLAFKALLDAAELPGTRMTADGQGSVTLDSNPAMHEALRFLLNHLRSQARPAGTN